MEDILEVYTLPYDPEIPLICMDEQPYQLLSQKYEPTPMQQDRVVREDYQYVREGTCSIFMFCEPLGGRRHVEVSKRRTRKDWAHQVQQLLEVCYPGAKRVRLVCDNLNTHTLGSLYEAFSPEVALGLAKRLERHFTPKHGSWLNITEIELSAMTVQSMLST